MITDLTKLAAMVSGSLKKVDNNMLNQGSSGPANKLQVEAFVSAQPSTSPASQVEVGRVVPLPQPPIQTDVLARNLQPPQAISTTSLDTSRIEEHLESIAKELSKINKKLVSVQKYYNSFYYNSKTKNETSISKQES